LPEIRNARGPDGLFLPGYCGLLFVENNEPDYTATLCRVENLSSNFVNHLRLPSQSQNCTFLNPKTEQLRSFLPSNWRLVKIGGWDLQRRSISSMAEFLFPPCCYGQSHTSLLSRAIVVGSQKSLTCFRRRLRCSRRPQHHLPIKNFLHTPSHRRSAPPLPPSASANASNFPLLVSSPM